MTVGSLVPKRIVFQVADVHKPLFSITACSDMGMSASWSRREAASETAWYDCFLGTESDSLRDRITWGAYPTGEEVLALHVQDVGQTGPGIS